MKPLIFGFKGKSLSDEERSFFLEHQPAGFIIFKRNIESKEQLMVLCTDLTGLFGGREVMILIDQEGGRVQRLTEPLTKKYPAPSYFSSLIDSEGMEAALKACYDSNLEMALELKEIGININCAPVADLTFEGASNVIGDRSFGSSIDIVVQFCSQAIKAHLDAGIKPIIKHMPGHGRAKSDSHFELPFVDALLPELESTDFAVFQELAKYSSLAMTAHIVYRALDTELPATTSKTVINYIKDAIGFKGQIITDCITMKALSGSFAERTTASLEAGCDYVLHCNGEIGEMQEIADCLS